MNLRTRVGIIVVSLTALALSYFGLGCKAEPVEITNVTAAETTSTTTLETAVETTAQTSAPTTDTTYNISSETTQQEQKEYKLEKIMGYVVSIDEDSLPILIKSRFDNNDGTVYDFSTANFEFETIKIKVPETEPGFNLLCLGPSAYQIDDFITADYIPINKISFDNMLIAFAKDYDYSSIESIDSIQKGYLLGIDGVLVDKEHISLYESLLPQ